MKSIILFFVVSSFAAHLHAQEFSSGGHKVQLLELYSSQGCSSCPPAERWVSKFKSHPALWNDVVPLVFHVDYWDYLGWKDPFSNKRYSQRQRTYYAQRAVSSVYTPGLILDGQEWRGWYKGRPMPQAEKNTQTLHANINNNQVTIRYNSQQALIANVALLGFGIETSVKHGENSGRDFSEDFIVLNMQSVQSSSGQWVIPVNLQKQYKAKRYGLAIWVNKPESLQPLQATGGWLQM